MISKVMMRCTI